MFLNIKIMCKNKIIYILSLCLLSLTISCEKSEIMTYKAEDAVINFPNTWDIANVEGARFAGASYVDSLFYKNLSFLDSVGYQTALIHVPIKATGPMVPYNREVSYEIIQDSCNTVDGDYEILSSFIPAGEIYGDILIRVKNQASLSVEAKELWLKLKSSEHFEEGYVEYSTCKVTWSEMLAPPTHSFAKRTYNYLIATGEPQSSISTAAYSQNAHRLILIILETNEIPRYNAYPWMIYANSAAYAGKMMQYINDNPDEEWVHDSGELKGKKIYPRGYEPVGYFD